MTLCATASSFCSSVSAGTASSASGQPEPRARNFERRPPHGRQSSTARWTMRCGRATPLPTGEFLSYNPLHGDPIPQKTTVWFAYDADYLYFAFKCDDPDPSGIKTSITRRDNIWQDDWVGLSLDALGTGQLSYHMMVNPSGVQLDMLNSVAGNEDPSPDWIWDSAGRLTETGYAVEIRLPLQSIRFKGGDDPRMGILFWRRVSRLWRVGFVAGIRPRRVGLRASRVAPLRQPRAASGPRDPAERDLQPHRTSRIAARAGLRPTAGGMSGSASRSASRPRSRWTRRSIPTSARSKATRSRSKSISASRCSSARSGRSSWKAPGSSRSRARVAATTRCGPPCTPAASSIRSSARR